MNFCFPQDFFEKNENENYTEYLDRLYDVFKNEILNKLSLNGLPIRVREYPPNDNCPREEAFYHLTCRDYKGQPYRQPDFNRSKRIKLIKIIIENVMLCPNCVIDECNGILIWKEKNRYHLMLQEKSYLLVLEKREKYFLLITAFYVEPSKLEHYLKQYDRYKTEII